MTYNVATISGDGIGPEIVEAAKAVLNKVAKRFDLEFLFSEAVMGGAAIDLYGEPMPKSSVDVCLKSDSVLLGAVGGYKWDNLTVRPEAALLGIRKQMELFANFRVAKLNPSLSFASPLNADILADGIDIILVRELTGGIYFGERGYKTGSFGREAFDTERISELEIERILRAAYELAEKRSHRLCSVDKANVLETSRLWRKIAHDLNEDYPTVTLTDMLVDNCAMQLAKKPSQFDVIATSNLFGDILSDLMAALVGSIGIMPSASLGVSTRGLYEPIHGSAPDIAGKNLANPIGTILSAAMMLELSFNLGEAAFAIRQAVDETLKEGYCTADIYFAGKIPVSTAKMTEMICSKI